MDKENFCLRNLMEWNKFSSPISLVTGRHTATYDVLFRPRNKSIVSETNLSVAMGDSTISTGNLVPDFKRIVAKNIFPLNCLCGIVNLLVLIDHDHAVCVVF